MSEIHLPTVEERRMAASGNVCGECKYFELAEGQKQMEAQRFVERLVREQEWKVEHLCSPTNALGLCGAADAGTGGDQTITGRMHMACDQFRQDQGSFSLRKAAKL